MVRGRQAGRQTSAEQAAGDGSMDWRSRPPNQPQRWLAGCPLSAVFWVFFWKAFLFWRPCVPSRQAASCELGTGRACASSAHAVSGSACRGD